MMEISNAARIPVLAYLILTSCSSSPEPDYFMLAVRPGAVASLSTQIELTTPQLPKYLDRLDILSQEGAFGVDIDQTRRWAAPLDDLLLHTLTEDMRQRMPNSMINTVNDITVSLPRYKVAITVEAFNKEDVHDVLRAQIRIGDKRQCQPQVMDTTTFSAMTSSDRMEEGLSNLVGKMADVIVVRLIVLDSLPACLH